MRWKIYEAVFHRMEKHIHLKRAMRKVEIGWRTENEEGIKMEMVAIREKSKYSYKFCLKGEDEWTFVDKMSLEHLQGITRNPKYALPTPTWIL